MSSFTYLVRLNDLTYETFTDYNRAHHIGDAIRRHAEKTGTAVWRRSVDGRSFYVGPGQVLERPQQ